ncbi:unnamed protein product [Paramecium sonneborni]|uniref:MORN repeat protein n=1 Tax=Paramecium sonneborni TaxID=65129 RepID=A0A8S1QH77_9CILI|nr:unnamed protein product [Paramecium sonneborni]
MGQKNSKETKNLDVKNCDQNKEKIENKLSFNERAQSRKSEQKSLPIIYQYKSQFEIPQQQNEIFQENDVSFLKGDGENQECGNLEQSTINMQAILNEKGLSSFNDGQNQSQDEKLVDVLECKNKLKLVPLILQDEQNPLVIKELNEMKFEMNQEHDPTKEQARLYKGQQIMINNLRIAGIWKYLGPYIKCIQNKQPYLLNDNSIYIGEWFERKRHGFGYQINDDYIYEGYWHNDKYHGNGRIIYENGNVYIGQFQEGQYDGEGFLKNTDQNNIIYEGQWSKGIKNGFGREQMCDGQIYIGQFKQNERHGPGKLFNLRDQYIFEGEWMKGNIYDKGIVAWQDGRRFEGDWKNNMMNGQGIFYWPGGKKYVGNYLNNMRDGYGEYYYKDGKIYKGMWKDGLMNGYGVIIYPNNSHEMGIWNQGKKIDFSGNQKHKRKGTIQTLGI